METKILTLINNIEERLTKDNRFDHMVWVGRNFSIKDLKDSLKEIKDICGCGVK